MISALGGGRFNAPKSYANSIARTGVGSKRKVKKAPGDHDPVPEFSIASKSTPIVSSVSADAIEVPWTKRT